MERRLGDFPHMCLIEGVWKVTGLWTLTSRKGPVQACHRRQEGNEGSDEVWDNLCQISIRCYLLRTPTYENSQLRWCPTEVAILWDVRCFLNKLLSKMSLQRQHKSVAG